MTTVTTEPTYVQLSRDELLLVLALINAETIPGIDGDPLGALDGAQQAVAQAVAARGLRARGLAQQENGTLRLHTAVLDAAATCAYATQSLLLFHWPSGDAAPQRLFGHVRQDTAVLHRRPADVLHHFAIFADKQGLIAEMVAACEPGAGETAASPFALSRGSFVQVREAASGEDVATAVATLTAAGVAESTAAAFASTLAASPPVSVGQTLAQAADGSVTRHDFTLIAGEAANWLVVAESPAEDAPLLVNTVTRAAFADVLAAWL